MQFSQTQMNHIFGAISSNDQNFLKDLAKAAIMNEIEIAVDMSQEGDMEKALTLDEARTRAINTVVRSFDDSSAILIGHVSTVQPTLYKAEMIMRATIAF